MTDVMRVSEAWAVLGIDFAQVVARLRRYPKEHRVAAAEVELDRARGTARKLMIVHHPDRGGDPEKFKKVGIALRSLEYHHAQFVGRMKEALRIREMERRKNGNVLIVTGPRRGES
jgi:hypothetical protein